MAKRTKKNDPQQKNKQGFDSAKTNSEFSRELNEGSGSAAANRAHKEKAKRARKSKQKLQEI